MSAGRVLKSPMVKRVREEKTMNPLVFNISEVLRNVNEIWISRKNVLSLY